VVGVDVGPGGDAELGPEGEIAVPTDTVVGVDVGPDAEVLDAAPVDVPGCDCADDGNPCTVPECDSTGACTSVNAPKGTACEFGTCDGLTSTCLFGYTSVVAGQEHVCALRDDGTVWCWGQAEANVLGQSWAAVGAGGWTEPTQVPGLQGVTMIAAGWWHTCALLSDGTVKCWGDNLDGQTGVGKVGEPTFSPSTVAGLGGVSSIAAGFERTCAVTTDGAVYCFGNGEFGANGDGTWNHSVIPVQVKKAPGYPWPPAKAVAIGRHSTCALVTDGTVWCWGYNYDGQLGNGFLVGGEQSFSVYPAPVVDGASTGSLKDVTAIASGAYSVCALKGGNVWCWGANDLGQLGDKTQQSSSKPRQVVGVGAALSLVAGDDHACATSEGGVSCWGSNSMGQLGDGNAATASSFSVPVEGTEGVEALGAGSAQTCAIDTYRRIWCWGRDPMTIWQATPAKAALGFKPTQISSRNGTSCAIAPDANLWCWGQNDCARAGLGDEYPRDSPVLVAGIKSVKQVSVGESHTCAVTTDGKVWCWGCGSVLDFKTGQSSFAAKPTVMGNPETMVAIAAGESFTCAISSSIGQVVCWGENKYGQCGQWETSKPVTVTAVMGADKVTQLVAGRHHVCALKADGNVVCWGSHEYGQLGTGAPLAAAVYSSTALPVFKLSGVTKLSSVTDHTCALLKDQTGACWGYNGEGRLVPNFGNEFSNAPVPLKFTLPSTILDLGAGLDHGCVIRGDGKVVCWGSNWTGQLGGEPLGCCDFLVEVQGLPAVEDDPPASLTLGTYTTCATTKSGAVYCWGSNRDGAAGLGNAFVETPTPVANLP
jgi:alpha-tubulin suppressor-like RCC1 family protein